MGLNKPEKQVRRIERYVLRCELPELAELSVKYLARIFEYDPNYLSRIYKSTRSQKLKSFINRRRFDMVNDLMTARSRLSTSEISHLVGFEDSGYFRRLVRKRV